MKTVTFIENGRKRKGITRICVICNKPFIARVNGDKKICSNACAYEYRGRNKVEIKCRWCGKTAKRAVSKVKEINFCSRKCKDEAQRLDGLTEIHPPHYGTGYSNYDTLIKRTANPCCTGCPEKRIYLLCVHHIDGDRTNNDKSNLEIVCFNCHAKRHLKQVDGKWVYLGQYLTPRELLGSL